jgi:DNA-binding NtrC family response regulator
MVTRIGENQSRKVKVRIISATNRDLRAIIASGRFREDLYYRLAVATLSLPPLRTRQCDIPLLIEHFLEKIALQTGCPVKTASVHLRQALTVYPWPGNIRQLKNVLESMCQLTESSILDISDLPPELQKTDSAQLLPNGITGLKAQEREIIIATIDRYGGNLRQAARALGIARSTLYEKMRNYGIRRAFISSNEDTYPESQA